MHHLRALSVFLVAPKQTNLLGWKEGRAHDRKQCHDDKHDHKRVEHRE